MENNASLYRQVKASLALQGTSLTDWCRKNEVSRQWAYQALTGKRSGQKARDLAKTIANAVGVY